MNKNRHVFSRICAVILAVAMLIQQTAVSLAAPESYTSSGTSETGKKNILNPFTPPDDYMSDDEFEEISEKYKMNPSSLPDDDILHASMTGLSGFYSAHAGKTSTPDPEENDDEEDIEAKAEKAFVENLITEYGSASGFMAFNASKSGLNLDLFREEGVVGLLERYMNSPKNSSIYDSLTKSDQANLFKVDELGAEYAKVSRDYEQLLTFKNQSDFDAQLIKEGRLGGGSSNVNLTSSGEINATKASLSEAKWRYFQEKTKWFRTGGRLFLRFLSLAIGAYSLYDELGKTGQLVGEYENMTEDDNAAPWLGRAGLSFSTIASAISAITSAISGSAPQATGTLAQLQAIVTGGTWGTITGIAVLVAGTIGAAWLVNTDEFKEHTSDWTWRNITYTGRKIGYFIINPRDEESYTLVTEMAKEMIEYPWAEHTAEGFREMYNYLEDLIYKGNSPRHMVKPAPGIGALKPNIYIYTESEQDVTVTFGMPQWLTKSIPDYSGSWKVNASPDGTLTAPDGSTFGYLFYESETQPYYFGKDEGWMIPADSRSEKFREILTAYGFNETEIRDFLEFWTVKLPEGMDVMMYPQLTETVDAAMPVSISPAPDHLFRLWFTFEPYEDQSVPEPVIKPIDREGYTVIEWGGVILKE